MNLKKIKILFSLILFFISLNFIEVLAHKKYEDTKGGKTIFSHKLDSEWDKGYCYIFHLNNQTQKTIYHWKISFHIPDGVKITSKRGFQYKKIGNKYIMSGLSRNENLQIGQKGVQLGFCADGKEKPENIQWDDETEEIYYDDEFDCSKMPNKTSCESGTAKISCLWNNNLCQKASQPNENGNENSNSGTLVCEINSGSGKLIEPNLIKNHSFENLQEYNIVKKWWNKLFGGKKSYKGQVKDLADWTESNNNFKIWNNDERLKAQHQDKFLEIDANNIISQHIQTKKDTQYKLSFYSLGGDELNVKWNGNTIHQKQNIYSSGNISWIQHEYIVNGIDGKSILSLSNTKQDYSNYIKPISYHDSGCKGKSQNECNGLCMWEDNLCVEKPQVEETYICGRENKGNILNLNAKTIVLGNKKKKIFCDKWNQYSHSIYTGDDDDYMRFTVAGGLHLNMGKGKNTFFHSIYSSQMQNSIIEGSQDGYNTLIISDENDDMFFISGDCSTLCTISLKSNIWNLRNGRRFQKNTFKNIHKIEFKNTSITYKNQIDETNCHIEETEIQCSKNYQENEKESQIRVGVDNITLYEIEDIKNTQKIDLFSLLDDALINNISNLSCSDIFFSLEENIKTELMKKLLASEDYKNIAQDFFESINVISKQTTVKNHSFHFIKDKITPCHTEEEKNAFYSEVYELSEENIKNCVVNNLNTQIQKHISMVNYLKTNIQHCTQNENSLTLNFFNSYGSYER